jgi:hypothetical protein
MRPRRRVALRVAALSLAASSLASCSADGPASSTEQPEAPDLEPYLTAPRSCAYVCPPSSCAEQTTPYACPALGEWSSIPHADACEPWDGRYPEVKAGRCTATEPTGEAKKRPGADGDARILPDGRRTTPAGVEWVFAEPDVRGGLTTAITRVPGTRFVITVDTGNVDHAVRAIDTAKIGQGDPVTGIVPFRAPEYLSGSAVFVAPDRVYVATAFGSVQALRFDAATGALTRDDEASLSLPPSPAARAGTGGPWYVASVAASPDGRRLVATPVDETRALLLDVDPASPSYRQTIGELDLGAKQTFAAAFDPHDAEGRFVYVSIWGGARVVELDLADPTAPVLARTFATDENPQGLAFLDARWMAVANDLGETISLVDRVSGDVSRVRVEVEPDLHGLDVSSLAYDEDRRVLYATLAGVNAVAAYGVTFGDAAPSLSPLGKVATDWWPGGVAVLDGGALAVTNLRGRGIGPFAVAVPIGDGGGDDLMRGSIQRIDAPSPADLEAGEAAVSASLAVGAREGYPRIDCLDGASDFPVPATNTEGPSALIEHVFFIVRENKTFDALLGDLPGVEGSSTEHTMKASSDDMDLVWPNLRALARGFVTFDNFYNLAVKSTQGHTWTTYGRANDFDERTWSDEARPVPLSGVGDIGRPVEGSMFEWFQANGVRYDLLGEIVGNPKELPEGYNPIDVRYPGGPAQNITYNDLEKACYTSARARVACDLGSFVYMTLPNDHTVGVSPDNPSPEVMCSVNDEATGMIVDAITHSPLWATSLIVITEDDPQQGGDHVDYHRTPLVMVSPWLKRGYVSKTHIDVPSLHKLFAHVLGLPYPNLIVKNAGLPLDAFSTTPDYTPYDHTHRKWRLECGEGASRAERYLTESWDFALVDEQLGLGDQIMRWMRGKQLDELPPRLKAQADARYARRAQGLPTVDEDDDD